MKWNIVLIPSIVASVLLASCSTGSTYSNNDVYRAPDGTVYKSGKIYKDRNGSAYRNGKVIVHQKPKSLPPGQAKKIYGGEAKDYAPGQRKKNKYYSENGDQDKGNRKHKNKNKNKNKNHDRDDD